MQARVKHGEQAAARMLLAIERAGEHPSFELLEAYTDARLAPAERALVDSHASHCRRCATELSQMREYAPQLSKKLKGGRHAASRARGARWFSARYALLGAGLAVFVGAVAVMVVWRATTAPQDNANDRPVATDAAPMPAPAQAQAQLPAQPASSKPAEFDRSVLDTVADVSPLARAAFTAGDYAALAEQLLPMAERGHPQAQAALGLLYAEGRGVRVDARIAERLWSQSEDLVPAAKRNLRLLRARDVAVGNDVVSGRSSAATR